MKIDVVTLGKQLRLLRGNRSQTEIEKLSGIPQYTISELENGKQVAPSFEMLVKLGRAYGLDPTAMAQMAGLLPAPADEDQRLVPGLRRVLGEIQDLAVTLPDDAQRSLAAVLRGVLVTERQVQAQQHDHDDWGVIPEFIRKQLRDRG